MLIWQNKFAMTMNFPIDFMWGVGHSSFQVEGSPQDSDWREWTRTPGKIADSSNAELATDFWNRYEEDFALAKELGANTFRLSIAWERVEPRRGEWDQGALDHYKKIIESCRSFGLEPVVTLQHFTLPLWLSKEGGLCSENFALAFADYAEKVAAFLSAEHSLVKWWMTFNEPMVMVNFGYITGAWPPGLKNPDQAMLAAKNLVGAHVEAVYRIRKLEIDDLKVSIAQHWRHFQAKSLLNPAHVAAAAFLHQLFNRNFVSACLTGKNFWWMPGSKIHGEMLEVGDAGTLDYLGINYYGRLIVKTSLKEPYIAVEEGPGIKNDLGWEICPISLVNVCEQAWKFKLPILISENGLADREDVLRSRFIRDHIDALGRAIESGVDVLGYLHWSLTDNFEWAEGLEPRFGLVAMDYSKMTRKVRPSFSAYKSIIAKLKKS